MTRRLKPDRIPLKVQVRVGQARYDTAALEINGFAAGPQHLARRRIVAHVDDALIADGDRGGERRFCSEGMKLSVEQNQIGLHTFLP